MQQKRDGVVDGALNADKVFKNTDNFFKKGSPMYKKR